MAQRFLSLFLVSATGISRQVGVAPSRDFIALLLGPLLMICLSCATPFPLENLEEGMMSETVHENFGEPEAMEAESGDTKACWSYEHEKQNWVRTIILGLHPLAILGPVAIGCPWNAMYVDTSMVLLDFEEGKLVSWDVYGPTTVEVLTPNFSPAPGAMPGNPSFFRYDYATATVCFPDPPTCRSVRAQQARLGVPKDYEQAYLWFSHAASNLPPGKARDDAIKHRDEAAKNLTLEQLAQAHETLRNLKPASATSAREGAPLAAVSLQVVDDVGSETSAGDVASFERVLASELAEAGFEVGEDPADLAIDIEVKELTTGSRFFSLRNDPAILRYMVTVSHPSGEILVRSEGERRLGDKLFADDDPALMSTAAVTELLIAQGAGDIVDHAQLLHRFPADAIARWSNRPAIQIVLKDQVGTEYSAAGSADLEEMLAEDLRKAGYRLGGGGDALTLEVEIVKYDPGSRAKRFMLSDLRFIGFPAMGASSLVYEATVLDASGTVLGRTEGKKRYTGTEITDDPTFKTHRQLREDMADHCAAQISEYLGTLLPVAAARHVSAP